MWASSINVRHDSSPFPKFLFFPGEKQRREAGWTLSKTQREVEWRKLDQENGEGNFTFRPLLAQMSVPELGASVSLNVGWNARLPPGTFYRQISGDSGRGRGWCQGSGLTRGIRWPTREAGHTMRPHAGSHAGVLSPSLGRGGRQGKAQTGQQDTSPFVRSVEGPQLQAREQSH